MQIKLGIGFFLLAGAMEVFANVDAEQRTANHARNLINAFATIK
jgi:hypothetical protein